MDKLHKLLYPHPAIVAALAVASGGGLGWVFWTGRENTVLACCFYPLCAYSLLVLCLRLIPLVLRLAKSPKVKTAAGDQEKRFQRSLVSGAVMNLAYALFQMAMGAISASLWTGSQGAYQLVMALIHFALLHYEGKFRRAEDPVGTGWRGFRACGIWLLALHLTMTGLTFQMIWQGETENYPSVMIYAVAAYAFCKLTKAIIRVIQYRKNANPLWGAAKNLDLSEAIMNLFVLQTALLHTFSGPDQGSFVFLMNSLTGAAVCLMTVLGAVGMIRHGTKKLKGKQGEHP